MASGLDSGIGSANLAIWEVAGSGVASTKDVAEHFSGAAIIKEMRGFGARPSDHVPVVVTFDHEAPAAA